MCVSSSMRGSLIASLLVSTPLKEKFSLLVNVNSTFITLLYVIILVEVETSGDYDRWWKRQHKELEEARVEVEGDGNGKGYRPSLHER